MKMNSAKHLPLAASLIRQSAFACSLSLGLAHALAIHPGQWVHATESDFAALKAENVVVTNLGDVKLSTASNLLADLKEHGTALLAMARAQDATLYLSMGSPGRLLQAPLGDAKQLTTLCDIPDGGQAFAMGVTAKGQLIVAVSAETSYLAELVDGSLQPLVYLPDVRYVWDMVMDQQWVYLATGPQGKLLRIDLSQLPPLSPLPPLTPLTAPISTNESPLQAPTESAAEVASAPASQPLPPAGVQVLFETKQDNLLCLGRDAQGRLYVGTDTDGLVYRLTLADDASRVQEAFVLLDADEPEIGSLLVLPDGTVYAATSDADQAQAMRMNQANPTSIGRPPMLPPMSAIAGSERSRSAAQDDDKTDAVACDDSPSPSQADFPSPSPSPSPSSPSPSPSPAASASPMPMSLAAELHTGGHPGGAGAGNAVYRIDPQGFSTEIFREAVTIYRLLSDPAHPGSLLLTTGNQGHVYRLTPQEDETVLLAKLQAQQAVTAMALPDGRVLLGTANPAKWLELGQGYAESGTLTSLPLDAKQASFWGQFQVTAQIPPNTRLTVETRSGNVSDPEKAPWSDWSAPKILEHDPSVGPLSPRVVSVLSPPARFFQYRLTMQSEPGASPIVRRVSLAHVMPNLRPSVQSIHATYPNSSHGGTPVSQSGNMPSDGPSAGPAMGGPQMMAMRAAAMARAAGGPSGGPSDHEENIPTAEQTLQIEWQASDPNQDQLRYRLEYQPLGVTHWLLLADDLTTPTYSWNTRLVPDGPYRLRVTASDAPDNLPDQAKTASRISDPVIVDNTPPTISNLKIAAGSASKNQPITITFTAGSHLTPLQSAAYRLDDARHWQVIFPDDLIFDSTNERLTIKLSPLAVLPAGWHVLTIRVTDGLNQSRFEAFNFEVGR